MKSFAVISTLFALVSAAPASEIQARQETSIRPSAVSTYNVNTGAITYGLTTGQIHKGIGSQADPDITTLLTFDVPASASGKRCAFVFDLNNCLHCNPSPPTGTQTFDVYNSLEPATHSTTSWPNGNMRDQYVGRLKAQKPGTAISVEGSPFGGVEFPCPAGKKLAGELVGVGDRVNVQWDGKGEGPYIRVY